MATITRNDIQKVKLRKIPLPKVPPGDNSSQKEKFSANNEGLSVAAARQRFETKPITQGNSLLRSSSSRNGVEPSGNSVVSASSARDKFGRNPPPWKQANVEKTKAPNSRERTKEISNKLVPELEPRRKNLPPPFRIGPAPRRKPKPENLKFLLRKYKDKIVFFDDARTAVQTSSQGTKHGISGLKTTSFSRPLTWLSGSSQTISTLPASPLLLFYESQLNTTSCVTLIAFDKFIALQMKTKNFTMTYKGFKVENFEEAKINFVVVVC